MVTAGSALPAAIRGEQISHTARIDVQRGGEPSARQVRAAGQVVGDSPQPGQRAQLHRDSEPVLVAIESAYPAQIIAREREEG